MSRVARNHGISRAADDFRSFPTPPPLPEPVSVPYTPTMPEPKLYELSTHIGSACARKMVTFQQLAEKLKMDVTELSAPMQCKDATIKSPGQGVGSGAGHQRAVPRKARGSGPEGSWLRRDRTVLGQKIRFGPTGQEYDRPKTTSLGNQPQSIGAYFYALRSHLVLMPAERLVSGLPGWLRSCWWPRRSGTSPTYFVSFSSASARLSLDSSFSGPPSCLG